jgi:copper chaperone for superoxide dismutase
VEAKLEDQLVLVEGTAAPSSIVAAIQDTGRDAIIRGSGLSDSELLLRFLFFFNKVAMLISGLTRRRGVYS